MLEGTLNQIQLHYPRRMMDLEAKHHLRDCLFHGVRKHIHNSVQYLCNTPGISHTQLMIAAPEVENKNEETQDRIRARTTLTTKPVEEMAELKHQIAQLMPSLT